MCTAVHRVIRGVTMLEHVTLPDCAFDLSDDGSRGTRVCRVLLIASCTLLGNT